MLVGVQHGEDAPAVEAKRKQLQAAALSSNARRAKQFYKVTVKVRGQPVMCEPVCHP